jgi:hypothetical protein
MRMIIDNIGKGWLAARWDIFTEKIQSWNIGFLKATKQNTSNGGENMVRRGERDMQWRNFCTVSTSPKAAVKYKSYVSKRWFHVSFPSLFVTVAKDLFDIYICKSRLRICRDSWRYILLAASIWMPPWTGPYRNRNTFYLRTYLTGKVSHRRFTPPHPKAYQYNWAHPNGKASEDQFDKATKYKMPDS